MPCPGLAEHILKVYIYETSYLLMKIYPDCVHVMVIDVAVTLVTLRVFGVSGMILTPVIDNIKVIIYNYYELTSLTYDSQCPSTHCSVSVI